MPLLIDGYNLLWTMHKLDDSKAVDDIQMCRIIEDYLRRIKEKGQVVFDGIGPPDKSCLENMSNPEVVFAGTRLDADKVIEDKIRVDTAPRRLIVVSSDRRIRAAARARKAVSMKSEDFWKDVEKQLARKKTSTEPQEKKMGISKSETEQWLKFFEIGQ